MDRTVLYLRVSTSDQTTKNQQMELEQLAQLRDWNIIDTYEDIESATKGRDQRPGLDKLMKDATKRKFDRVLFWSVDRCGRSTAHVATIMAELDELGVNQFYFKESLDTSTPHGAAMLEMSAVFAKLEHKIIKNRIMAGLARARAEGIRLGRPPLDDKIKDAVIALRREGKTIRGIASEVGISRGAVHKVIVAGVVM